MLSTSNGIRGLLCLLLLLVAGCQVRETGRPADVVIEDAHNGGSILAFSPDARLLASGGWEGRLRLWALPSGKPVRSWQAHDDSVNGAVFIRQGSQLISAGYDGWIRRWTLQGKLLRQKKSASPVTSMRVDERAGVLLTGHADGHVRLFRLRDFALLKDRKLHDSAVRTVARHHASNRWASSGHDGRVFVWHQGGRPVQLPSPPSDARALVFSPDGKVLIGGGWFKLFRWQLASKRLRVIATPHNGIIKSLQFTANGRELASISRQTDSSIYFLDPRSGKLTRRFRQHELCGGYLRLSPFGKYLATTSDDASVRIWRLKK